MFICLPDETSCFMLSEICDNITEPNNLTITYDYDYYGSGEMIVRLKCKDGFMTNIKSAKCSQEDQKWEPSTPKCYGKPCFLSEISNTMNYCRCLTIYYVFKTTCK